MAIMRSGDTGNCAQENGASNGGGGQRATGVLAKWVGNGCKVEAGRCGGEKERSVDCLTLYRAQAQAWQRHARRRSCWLMARRRPCLPHRQPQNPPRPKHQRSSHRSHRSAHPAHCTLHTLTHPSAEPLVPPALAPWRWRLRFEKSPTVRLSSPASCLAALSRNSNSHTPGRTINISGNASNSCRASHTLRAL
ncbi:hypothetical protein M011DRAFT_286220 [Sporormia fimetaria CBS 119925]|uniref:Uncharacterized protein n=1 Tax=Sporormia fimetaria CBS 119925 TaxID=1340428 RepID=A0A6A6VHA8_9PLEO|nr:hypothetical protein M011DRAFT_286220 [Sporormia fimetaria CBS 119925]